MAMLFSVEGVSKSFVNRTLLDNVSFSVFENEKIALVGKNGSGKSTLLNIILDDDISVKGNINITDNLKAGNINQHDDFNHEESVMDYLLRKSNKEEWMCGKFAGYFEIKGEMLRKKISELSGGYQTRIKLIEMFLHEPNFIFLDEPTNYLDLNTLILLEKVLKNFSGGYFIISHDRKFLNNLCTRTLSIINGKLHDYKGNIEEFESYRKELMEHTEKYNKNIEQKKKQLNNFITKFKAKATKASQAKSKEKQLQKLKTKDVDVENYNYNFKLPTVKIKKGVYAIRLSSLSIGYDDKKVADHIDFEILQGEKLHFVGNNGEGKTTLLNTIFGTLPKLTGKIEKNVNLNVGYYSQNVYESLDNNVVAYDYLTSMNYSGIDMKSLRNLAGSFRFGPDELDRKISTFSGGERARLLLCSLMLGNYNTLVLDEPTNHLDIETIEALIYALINFSGTLIIVSHDQYFASKLNFELMEIDKGKVFRPVYNFNKFLDNIEDNVGLSSKKINSNCNVIQKSKLSYKKQKILKSEYNRLKKALDRIEIELDESEKLKNEKNQKLNIEFSVELTKEIEALENSIEILEFEWIEKSEKFEEVKQEFVPV